MLKDLTRCEEIVMIAIWSLPPEERYIRPIYLKVVEISGNEWYPENVTKYIRRLVDMGYLKKVNIRKHFYEVIITREEYRRNYLTHMIKLLYSEDIDRIQSDLSDAIYRYTKSKQ